MKIKLQKITSKDIQTKYGVKQKLGLFDGKTWYGCWKNKTTATYKEGDIVEGDITSREYNGQTYYDFEPISIEQRIEIKLDKILELLSDKNENEKPFNEVEPF